MPGLLAGRRREGRARFTLIELLVVVAIIAILAAMLLPALTKARTRAQQETCRANEKQLGMVFQMYGDEQDDFLPYSMDSAGIPWAYKMSAVAHLNIPAEPFASSTMGSIFNCPTNVSQNRICGTGAGESQLSYTANGWDTQASGVFTDNRPMGRLTTRFNNPSELYLLLESVYFRVDGGQNNGAGDGAGCVGAFYGFGCRNMRYAHNKGSNITFADGHAEGQSGMLPDRGAFQGTFGSTNRYVNGRPWFAYYPF